MPMMNDGCDRVLAASGVSYLGSEVPRTRATRFRTIDLETPATNAHLSALVRRQL